MDKPKIVDVRSYTGKLNIEKNKDGNIKIFDEGMNLIASKNLAELNDLEHALLTIIERQEYDYFSLSAAFEKLEDEYYDLREKINNLQDDV